MYMKPERGQRGMTMLETLGGLALASALLAGLSTVVAASMGDTKAQLAAQHQAQVAAAAGKYIAANHTALLGMTAAGAVAAVTVAQMQAGGFLPDGFAAANAFGQTPCTLVRQTASGQLDALVATYGGTPVPESDLAQLALLAGQGGGYIRAGAPDTARGATWELSTAGYRNVSCGAGPVVLTGEAGHDGGRLASNLLHDAPWQLPGDFLRRGDVAGQPEANRMHAPIHLAGSGAQATEGDTSDPRCTVADSGKVAADAAGRLLACQEGVWRRQGDGYWRDPVAAYAGLPAAGNQPGDVRMVSGLNRAYTWDGAAWQALAADRNGDFRVPQTAAAGQLGLRQMATHNAACAAPGTLARDARGLALSCESGRWRNPLEFRLSSLVYEQEWMVRVDDGSAVDSYIDLTSLPGPRPLYMTGYALCHATGFPRAYAYINMEEEGGPGFIAGGCLSRPDNSGAGVLNTGSFGLQEIPDNVTRLRLHREVEPGAAPEAYIRLAVKIYSSE